MNTIRKNLCFLAFLLLCFAGTAFAEGENTIRFAREPGLKVMNFHAKWSRKGDTFTLVTGGYSSAISFSGNWNLVPYNKLCFTLRNLDPAHSMRMYIEIQDKPQKLTAKGARKYFPEGTYSVYRTLAPGETREVEIDLPAPLPHPEVADHFTRMKYNPYCYALKANGYNVDWSSVSRIKFIYYSSAPGRRCEISDVRAIPGGRTLPASSPWLSMGPDEFYPFVDEYGQFLHEDWPGKIHCDADFAEVKADEDADLAAHPGPEGLDRFGGWKDGPRYEATGSFRVQKIDGKWWLIDPDGYLFWSHGVVRVSPSSAVTPLDKREDYFSWLPSGDSPFARFYHTHDALLKPYYTARGIQRTYDFSSSNLYRKYGENYLAEFADRAHRRLRSWGLNTIANSSDRDICLMDRTPYIERIEINESPVLEGAKGGWWKIRDPYNPGFEEEIRRKLTGCRQQLDDPWCIGYFVDNEMRWGENGYLAKCTVTASEQSYAKQAMVKFLKAKYKKVRALNAVWGTSFKKWEDLLSSVSAAPKEAEEDMQAFNTEIIRRYFSTIRRIFKEMAPDKLYMGCRFAGSNRQVISIGAEYCDIMSWNAYENDLYGWLDNIREWFDKPVMIGEFHFGALDRGKFHPSLLGVTDQEQRGQAYYDYVKSALKHDLVVGTHWHQFADQATTGRFDGENLQVGFTDMCDTPYPETIAKIREIGYNLYRIRYY